MGFRAGGLMISYYQVCLLTPYCIIEHTRGYFCESVDCKL